jgi:hypothetical protein
MKSLDKRIQECCVIRAQLLEHLGDGEVPKELVEDMNHFVRDGWTVTKSIFVPLLGRTLKYTLSTKQDSYAVIKAKPDFS